MVEPAKRAMEQAALVVGNVVRGIAVMGHVKTTVEGPFVAIAYAILS